MSISVEPATLARFDDLRPLVGPKRDDATVCADTDSVSGGFPRVPMRLDLR